MIEVFGDMWHFNLDKIDEFVNLPIKDSCATEGQHISILKYEMIKMMSDVILSEQDEVDEKLGQKSSVSLSIPFRLAWNTMLRNKLIEKL